MPRTLSGRVCEYIALNRIHFVCLSCNLQEILVPFDSHCPSPGHPVADERLESPGEFLETSPSATPAIRARSFSGPGSWLDDHAAQRADGPARSVAADLVHGVGLEKGVFRHDNRPANGCGRETPRRSRIQLTPPAPCSPGRSADTTEPVRAGWSARNPFLFLADRKQRHAASRSCVRTRRRPEGRGNPPGAPTLQARY